MHLQHILILFKMPENTQEQHDVIITFRGVLFYTVNYSSLTPDLQSRREIYQQLFSAIKCPVHITNLAAVVSVCTGLL